MKGFLPMEITRIPPVTKGPRKGLNFAQLCCKGPCKRKRSIGQFRFSSDFCDQCFLRMPKAYVPE